MFGLPYVVGCKVGTGTVGDVDSVDNVGVNVGDQRSVRLWGRMLGSSWVIVVSVTFMVKRNS